MRNLKFKIKLIKMKRKIEIFSAGCPICEEQIQQIKDASCPSCEIEVLNVNSDKDALAKSRKYGIRSLPAVAINGVLADCCLNRGIDINVLKSMGLGVAISG